MVYGIRSAENGAPSSRVEGNKESTVECNTRSSTTSTSDRDRDQGLSQLQLQSRGSASMTTNMYGHGQLFGGGGVARFASFSGGPPAYSEIAPSSSTFGYAASAVSMADSSPSQAFRAQQTAYSRRAASRGDSFDAFSSAASEKAPSRRGRALPAARDEDSDQSFCETSGPHGGTAWLQDQAPPPPDRQSSAPKYRMGSHGSRRQQRSSHLTASYNADDSRQLDPLAQIISLQRWQGDWEFDHALLDACGLANSSKAHALLIESSQTSSWKSIWGTILVVVYLERKMVAEKDVWELVVDKAKAFLQLWGVNMQDEMGKSPLKELLMDIRG